MISFAIDISPFIVFGNPCQCDMSAVHKSKDSRHVMRLIESKNTKYILFTRYIVLFKILPFSLVLFFLQSDWKVNVFSSQFVCDKRCELFYQPTNNSLGHLGCRDCSALITASCEKIQHSKKLNLFYDIIFN